MLFRQDMTFDIVLHCKKKVELYTKNGGSSAATNIGGGVWLLYEFW
jgi:hypothetical protein